MADDDSVCVLREGTSLAGAFPRLNRHKLDADPRNLENVHEGSIQFLLASPTHSLMQPARMLKNSVREGLSIRERV